jgi:hypothetical protein
MLLILLTYYVSIDIRDDLDDSQMPITVALMENKLPGQIKNIAGIVSCRRHLWMIWKRLIYSNQFYLLRNVLFSPHNHSIYH